MGAALSVGLNLTPWLRQLSITDKRARPTYLDPTWTPAQGQIVREIERAYDEGRPARILNLKARQLGVSTISLGLGFSWATLFPNITSFVVAHNAGTTLYLLEKVHMFYENWQLKDHFPTRYASRRELVFKENNSSIRVQTARTAEALHGRTIQFFHGSECARWAEQEESMVAIQYAVPSQPGTVMIFESTANGIGNWFERTWHEAEAGLNDFVPLFSPWFTHHEYIPCGGNGCRNGTCDVCTKAAKIRPQGEDEKRLLDLGCDLAHLAWRRWAIPNLAFNSEDWFHEQMPSDPSEAFLTSGVRVFPEVWLKQVYEKAKPAVGRLTKDGFVLDARGPLRVYKPPSKDTEWGTYFIGADACQPPGTLVRRVARNNRNIGPILTEDLPIEQIKVGDRVVSFTMQKPRTGNSAHVRRLGRVVTSIQKRSYCGPLIKIRTERGRESQYTPDHRCVVRMDSPLAQGNHLVYLARRENNFRIGRSTWRRQGGNRTMGIRQRALTQGADTLWILSVHQTEEDAALDEAVLSTQYGVPLWQFQAEGQWREVMPLEQYWAKVGGNQERAAECLKACGLDIRFPFWQKNEGWQRRGDVVELRAINLRSGMKVLEVDEIQPGTRGFLKALSGSSGWADIEVTRVPYEGQVYSLEVNIDHTYVADGIVTHNCHGTVDGDYAAACVINRQTKEQVAVWHGRVNPYAFADELCMLGNWYNRAVIACESSGPGQSTIGRLVGMYPRLWHHRLIDRVMGRQRSEVMVGFGTNWQRKQWLVTQLADAVERGDILLHDRATFDELRSYSYYGDKGDVYGPADKARSNKDIYDPSKHDDLMMALGIAVVCERVESPVPPYETRRGPRSKDSKVVFGETVDMEELLGWEESA